jgi:glyoxylase-like metal-dependent hydrolase (beta-lactamase superfamily II)
MDVRGFTVGPVQENTWIARRERSGDERSARGRSAVEALLIDPGDEPDRLLQAVEALGVTVAAILITHTHFDHVGAVAPMARATGAPVYCPAGEVQWLEQIVAFPGFGPFEGYTPEHTVSGGDRLSLAGFDIDVIATPGHSPDHVTYSVAGEQAVFSGDVLFQGSVGRTDLPGADHATLMRSIATLLDALPDETRVFPGHMGTTTLGRERATNPFLRELAAR